MVFVTLVGGGNSTLCMAPLVCSAMGYQCAILTRRPEDWSEEVEVVNEDLGWMTVTSMKCKPEIITKDPAKCIPQSDIIFFCGVPIHHNPALLQMVKPHLALGKKVFIGTVCAYGAFNWVANRELSGTKCDYSLFGTQLIPWCCGTVAYGKTGVIFGAKRMLRIATECGTDPDGIKDLLIPFLRQKLVDTDFLASTLWPNNPSLHPPILYGLFKDWDGKTPYNAKDVPVLIYKELCADSAKYVIELDAELTSIVKALSQVFPENPHLKLDFGMKACVIENYEDQVADKTNAETCVRTNAAFGKHKIPYTTVEGGVVPTLLHKFFETDLPFGLLTWKAIADMCDVKIPLTEAIILWNQKLINKEYIAADGTLTGKHIDECIIPQLFDLSLKDLTKSAYAGPPPSKKAKI